GATSKATSMTGVKFVISLDVGFTLSTTLQSCLTPSSGHNDIRLNIHKPLESLPKSHAVHPRGRRQTPLAVNPRPPPGGPGITLRSPGKGCTIWIILLFPGVPDGAAATGALVAEMVGLAVIALPGRSRAGRSPMTSAPAIVKATANTADVNQDSRVRRSMTVTSFRGLVTSDGDRGARPAGDSCGVDGDTAVP